MSGWIKLHRKIIENPIFQNAELLQLFIHCLLKATHKEVEIIFNERLEKLEIGTFITGREVLSRELKQNCNSTYKRLKLLEKLGYISIKSNNKFSIVKVLKYKDYQIEDLKKEQPDNNQVTTKEQPDNTYKNEKNYKNNLSIEKNNFLSLISRGGFISIYGDAEKEINNLYEDLKLAYPLLDLNEVALRFKLSNKKSMRNHCLYIKSICSNLVNEIAEKKDRKQEVNETWQLMG